MPFKIAITRSVNELIVSGGFKLVQCGIYLLYFFEFLLTRNMKLIISDGQFVKAPGIDKVLVRVIKDCLPSIAPLLTSIIYTTFKSATFPLNWKTAEVIPLLKDGYLHKATSNCPISLLPVFFCFCFCFFQKFGGTQKKH